MKLSKFGVGWAYLKDSLAFIFKRPLFLVPIFFSWLVYVSVVLYLRYWHGPFDISDAIYLLPYILLITYSICFANMLMLELLHQEDRGLQLSLGGAIHETLFRDSIKAIPIAFIWAIVWLVLVILQALTGRKNRAKAESSLRDTARTLSGTDSGPFRWKSLGLSMLEKLVRMISFLSLPAIAWEDKGPFQAISGAFVMIRKNPVQFLSAYTLTGVAAFIMALPLIPIFIGDDNGVVYSSLTWTLVIIYEGIIWTLSIYLEQMTVGLLYLHDRNVHLPGQHNLLNHELLTHILIETEKEISGENIVIEKNFNHSIDTRATKYSLIAVKWIVGILIVIILFYVAVAVFSSGHV